MMVTRGGEGIEAPLGAGGTGSMGVRKGGKRKGQPLGWRGGEGKGKREETPLGAGAMGSMGGKREGNQPLG